MSTDRTENAILLRIDPWIFRLPDLTLLDKMLLNYVYSWSIQNRCCFSSDAWLAHKFGFTEGDIKTTLDLLQMQGYIRINRSFQGGARSLSFVFTDLPDACEGASGPDDIFKLD